MESEYLNPNEYMTKIEISCFSGNLDIESLNWVYKVEKFFDMTYVPEENHIKSWLTNSREGQPQDGINCKSQGDV